MICTDDARCITRRLTDYDTRNFKLCKRTQNKLNLPSNFVYDLQKERLFDENNEEIKLAKKEILS